MSRLKVMSVFGTRPEAIKMAPLALELSRRENIRALCCVTAQHREMLDSVLEVFSLKPDWDLDIMTPRQTLSTITSKCLLGMDEAIDTLKPDMILVHGDTSTTFAGALSAFYHKVPVGHVEAGLRTYDKYSPYPEEMNRKLVTAIADLYFCPTENNRANLAREGAARRMNRQLEEARFRANGLQLQVFAAIAREHGDVELVYPVHLSPVVQECAHRHLDNIPNIHLIAPLAADEMHNLMARCYLVLTDSGGLQEEAPALGKPVLVLRRETERPEAVTAGTVKLAGVAYDDIVSMARQLITDPAAYAAMAHAVNPYGDDQACRRIADAIEWRFGLRQTPPEEFQG